MSMQYMEFGEDAKKDYSDGRTKQAFKAETDINTILGKFRKTGVISHLAKFESNFGNFGDDFDFAAAQMKLNEGYEIFDALPAEVRREFNNNPGSFFEFVNRPENVGNLQGLLPELAKAGDWFPDVSSETPPDKLLDGGIGGGRRADDQVKSINGDVAPVAPVVETVVTP